MRQELLAPVLALGGYAELLLELARPAHRPDLLLIQQAITDLLALIDRVLPADGAGGPGADPEQESLLRHDLRNPLNAIKGYAELLLEDIEDQEDAALRPDLEKLLGETDSLLDGLERIVDFSGLSGSRVAAGSEANAAWSIAAGLMRSIRPLDAL
jgi:signal transduction histidine kinase